MKTWYAIHARAEDAEVSIYDEIGAFGVSAKGFLAELAALPEASPLTLRLNSPGGSVFDACGSARKSDPLRGVIGVQI